MKPSEVYRKAAEWMVDEGGGWGACEAIVNCCPYDGFASLGNFEMFFRPEDADDCEYWFGEFSERNHNIRVLALLLMSEISKDEERK